MRSDIAVGRVKVPKASNVLANQLRESILSGEFIDGRLLPTERELAELSGLARASVREALRILETEGLITTRPGRNGGPSICLPSADVIERSIGLYIRGQRVRFASLLETREAIEPATARLAALHRNEDDLAQMRAIHQRLEAAIDDISAYLAANVEWHLAVAKASHNELLIAFMTAIADAVQIGTDVEGLNPIEVRKLNLVAHARVLAAIEARDPEAAERRMARHVRAYTEAIKSRLSADSLEGAMKSRKASPAKAKKDVLPLKGKPRDG